MKYTAQRLKKDCWKFKDQVGFFMVCYYTNNKSLCLTYFWGSTRRKSNSSNTNITFASPLTLVNIYPISKFIKIDDATVSKHLIFFFDDHNQLY